MGRFAPFVIGSNARLYVVQVRHYQMSSFGRKTRRRLPIQGIYGANIESASLHIEWIFIRNMRTISRAAFPKELHGCMEVLSAARRSAKCPNSRIKINQWRYFENHSGVTVNVAVTYAVIGKRLSEMLNINRTYILNTSHTATFPCAFKFQTCAKPC